MKRQGSSTFIKSVLYAGFAVVVIAAPAKGDFAEVSVSSMGLANEAAAPRLNIDINSAMAKEERWGRHQIKWQDPRSIADPVDHQRKIEPLFVVKF